MRLIILFLITLFINLSARADILEATMYELTQEYELAMAEFMKEADAGNTEAYYFIGTMHYYGRGVPEDYSKAYNWYVKSANEHGELGDANAQNLLGNMSKNGEGVSKNFKTALEWYKKAASQGNDSAAYSAGNIYARGEEGVPVNPQSALLYWQQAANLGHVSAIYSAADAFAQGKGTTQNHNKAYELYLLAAEKYHVPSQLEVGLYAKNLAAFQDYAVALKWLTSAASENHPVAQHELGIMYLQGLGVEKNINKMLNFFKKSASYGYPTAAYNMGQIFEGGELVEKDETKALEYYEQSGKLGLAEGQRKAALAHFNGIGTSKDPVKAVAWLIRAAQSDPTTNENDKNQLYNMLNAAQKQEAEKLASTF